MSNALAVRHTAEDSTARTNAVSSAQAKRYWPGRAPDWVEEGQAADEESSEEEKEKEPVELEEEPAATSIAAPVVLKKVSDPRLARLDTKKDEDGIAAPRILSRRQARGDSEEASDEDAKSSEESEEEDEEVTARRLAVRERLKKVHIEEEEILPAAEEEEEEEEESEYETDSEDEQFGRPMLKPMFIAKKDRETIAERIALEKEEEEAMKREKAKLAERALQTKEIVIQQLQAEQEAAKAQRDGPKQVGDIDTDDEKDPEAEYETWRIRELGRIRRDREEREALKEAEAEKERLRTMTPEQRLLWERENPKEVSKAPKSSWKFMQKYWHKGAFFQDVADNPHASGQSADEIFKRDFSAPVGEDKLNREILPKVMQVKNFGRRGRTKYTHLLDQDTTVENDYYVHEGLPQKPGRRRLAGTDQVFEKPKKFNT